MRFILMIWPASIWSSPALLDREALLVPGVHVVDLHRQDAVVAVLEGHFQAAVAAAAAAA